jgi:hypothetical protein
VALVGPAILFLVFWTFYAFARYEPLDVGFQQVVKPCAVGSGAGLLLTIAAVFANIRNRRRVREQNMAAMSNGAVVEIGHKNSRLHRMSIALIAPLGAMMLGGMTSLSLCYAANALFDKSAAKPVPIAVTKMIQVTHRFVFREYKLEYRFLKEQATHSLMTTPQHLSEFTVPLGVAQVRAGWLGWPWVETIDPIHVARPGAHQE